MEEAKNHYEIQIQRYFLRCLLCPDRVCIEITTLDPQSKLYSIDIPENPFQFDKIFTDIKDLYEYISNPTPNQVLEISKPEELTLLVPIRNTVKRVPIALKQKELSLEAGLKRRIQILQIENERLKKIQKQSIQDRPLILRLQDEHEKIRKQLLLTKRELQERKKREQNDKQIESNNSIKSEERQTLLKENRQMKEEIDKLQKQNTRLQSKVNSLETDVSTLQLLAQELDKESNQSNLLIKSMIKENNKTSSMVLISHESINPEGTLLIFQPLSNSKAFQYSNRVLSIKSSSSSDGLPKMIVSQSPIPSTGRSYFKIKILKTTSPFPLQIGVKSGPNSQLSVPNEDPNSIMYSRISEEKQIIFEGCNQYSGFPLNEGQVLTVVIDQTSKEVEWIVNGQPIFSTFFPQSMKDTDSLYFFIQMWSQGHEVEMLQE